LHRAARHRLGRELCGEGRALARALEADVARRRPGNRVALLIGDRDDRVVERRLDVRDAIGNVLALAPLRSPSSCGRLGHDAIGSPVVLLTGPLLPGDRLLRALPGAGVGTGALTADGEPAPVAQPLVRPDLHLALDVRGDLAAEVTLDFEIGVD